MFFSNFFELHTNNVNMLTINIFFMFEIPFKSIRIQTIFSLGLKHHWLKQKDGKGFMENHVHFQV
jgi:hypothetical protein